MTQKDIMLEIQAIDGELNALKVAQEANDKLLYKLKREVDEFENDSTKTAEEALDLYNRLTSLRRRSELIKQMSFKLLERQRRLLVTVMGPAGGELFDHLMRDS